ncbi:hypothetical protein GEMRC1_009910 [Eukaryota sp. GEM-RC1]
MEPNTGNSTDVTSSLEGCDTPLRSFSSRTGGEPHVSNPRPSHEEYELPFEAPFTAEIATVAYSATAADIIQAFSSLPVKEVRSPSNMPGTHVASASQSSVKPLNTSTFSSKPNTEPKPLELLPLTTSFQSTHSIHFQQSLLILIHFHMLSSMLKSILECHEYRCGDLYKLKKDLLPVFKKCFFKQTRFMSFLMTFLNSLHLLLFFGAEIQSVFLHVYDSFKVEEFLSYDNVISGLELELENHNDLEFLNKSSLFFPRLKQLDVRVHSSIFIAFIELLKTNATITIVTLSYNSIGDEDVRALTDALKVNATVTVIDLQANYIGDEGARALAEALKVNDTVTLVNMSYNCIRNDGARALAEALKVNTTVTCVYLRSNAIGDEGARALAEALKVNTTITTIELSSNSIGDEGARALAEALKVNRVVEVKY